MRDCPLRLTEFMEVKNESFTLANPTRPRLRQVNRNGKDDRHDRLMDTLDDCMSKRHQFKKCEYAFVMQDIQILHIDTCD